MFTHRRPLTLLVLILLTFAVVASPVSAGFSSRGSGALLPTGSASLSLLVLKGYTDVGPAPLQGAFVQLLDASTGEVVASAFTNERGLADFRLEAGNYSLAIDAKGKLSHFTKWLTVEANQDYSITVTLLPPQ